ncbi:MAG: glutamate--tRNA ligase [Patescibacteria group bacterium]|nr:glutamate--tRNA ligase [Patescibacteria group bacterium]
MPNDNSFENVRVRSAPSPTGRPHIGTAYNALFNYVFARKHDGKFILRIEDTDRSRYDADSEREIIDALTWLGLEPNESPKKGGEYGPYRQSERLDIYKKYVEQLLDKGAAYYCFCSEERLERIRERARREGKPPMYDGHCRSISRKDAEKRIQEGEEYVVRLKVPKEGTTKFHDLIRGEIEVENQVIDDQVLLKSDGFPTYHLANVVDDHLMEISHIIRGEEWLSSVPKHILLYTAFDWAPPVYAHTPLLRGEGGAKLGKRHGALPIFEYKKMGILPEALLNYLALLGWTHPQEKEFFGLKEMIDKFQLEDMDATAPIYDPDKLKWLNGKWIRALSVEELAERLRSVFAREAEAAGETSGVSADPTPEVKEAAQERFSEIVSLVQDRMETLCDFEELARFFFEAPEVDKEPLVEQAHGDEEEAKAILEAAAKIIEETELEHDALEQAFRSKAKEEGWGMRAICMTTRVAITGKTVSPPLFDCVAILGREETLTRLNKSLELL